MSFGQPPPKTPYGDQDFVKEDWSPEQPSFAPLLVPRSSSVYTERNPAGVQNVPYSSLAPPLPPNNTLQQGPYGGQRQQNNQPDVASLVQSLTPEDQIFMRSWRRDSFFYRVLPLSAIGSGALFFYNQSRNLPQKPGRYLLISLGSYVIGKWSYKGELKKRLEVSPSNTPFIKALRELLGVSPRTSEFGTELGSDGSQDFAGFASSNDLAQQVNTGYSNFGSSEAGSRAHSGYSPHESDLSLTQPSDSTKPMTSYEELRARNRGLVSQK